MFWMTLLNGIEHVHTTNVSKMPMYNTLSKTHENFQNINSHHKGLIRHYSSLAYPGHINDNPASEGLFGRWESTALSRKVMASQCLLGDAGSKISHLESPRRCIKAELIRPQNDHFWWIAIAPQVHSSRKPISYNCCSFLGNLDKSRHRRWLLTISQPMYMCTCIHVYMSTYIRIYIYTYKHINIYTYLHIYI